MLLSRPINQRLLVFTGLYVTGFGLLFVAVLSATYPVFTTLGVKILLGGILLSVISLLATRSVPSVDHKTIVIGGTVAILVLWLPVALFGYSTEMRGERYWWLGDDAMISMRYARQLAAGNGLVWNPGERVEGYTNFLWTLYMALIHRLPIPLSKTSLAVMLTNIVLAVATVPALVRLTRALGGSMTVTALVVAGFVLNRNEMYWATAGFETALLTLLFVFAAYRVTEEARTHTPKPLTAFVIAAVALVRADALLLSGLLYGLWLPANGRQKRVWLYAILSLLVVAASLVFRYAYYGDWLPNTAYLKTYNWDNRYESGLRYLLSFMGQYGVVIACAGVGAWVSRRTANRYWLLTLAVFAGYVVYAGGDVFEEFRFFLPVIPVLVALALVGIQHLQQSTTIKTGLSILCLVSLPLLVPGYSDLLSPRNAEIGNLDIALRLREQTPATSRIADTWAGVVPYFSERYAIDLLGKADAYIAHLKPFPGAMAPGHNKFDYTYSLTTYHPDYVVSFFSLPPDEDFLHRTSWGDAAFRGQLYFNDTFREYCLPHPVFPGTWRAVFRCQWE
ncbi:MAG: hypothetical protein HZC41_13960 [Chloroflexi bacterium]|nr:hypothetical protein [Chloroflexota bacterium]